MMLLERQRKLIGIMKDIDGWITGKELGSLLNVSDRTIRSDIDSINSAYGTILIEGNLRFGYHFHNELYHDIPDKTTEAVPQTPQERCMYIIQELLFQKQEINLIDLQNKVYVSGFSIDNDIKRIKKMIAPYDGLKLVRSKNYIHLEGDEYTKRKLYKELLTMETKGNFLNINKLASLYHTFDLMLIKQTLEETLHAYDFPIREMSFPILIVHISIAIERILQHNYIESDRRYPELMESIEYRIANEFYHKIAALIGIEIVEDEIVLLALLILGKRSSKYTGRQIIIDDKVYDIKELVMELLEDIYTTFDIDLRSDEEVSFGLQMHLQSMIERQNNQIAVNNVYLQELKKKYPMVFEMGVRAGRFLEEKIGQKMDENEIGFIALHLGSAYDRSSTSGKYRALMIYPDDQSLRNHCAQKIEQRFCERMEIVGYMSLFEEQQVLEINPDFIITSLPLHHDLQIPTIQISLFMGRDDENQIRDILERLDKERSLKEFKETIVHLIKPQFFYTELQNMNVDEMITFLCEELYKEDYVKEDFKAGVLQRERMSATSFSYGFAIPHAFHADAKQSCLSIAILKEPMQWGEFEVRLIILIAMEKENHNMLRIFFDWLNSVVSNSGKFARILGVKSAQEFIEQMQQYH